MKPALTVVLVLLALPAFGAGEDETVLFDFTTPGQIDEWHGTVKMEHGPAGLALAFEKPGETAWACWFCEPDWERFGRLVIEADSAAEGVELGLAVSDDGEFSVGIPVTLNKGANELSIPVAKLFEAGLQTRYVRGVALWARGKAGVVTLRKVRLAGTKPDLSNLPRFGERVLDDAERRHSNFFWYYSFESGRARVSEEHAASGRRSFALDFTKPGPVSSWGRFPHDWRGYEALAFDVFNPKETPVTLTVEIKDTWVSFFSRAYVAAREFELPPGRMTTVTFPLAGLEGRQGGKGEPGRLNLQYVQQILLKVPDDARPTKLYVDDVRLVGKAGSPFADAIAAADVATFGFEPSRDALKLPADLHQMTLTGPVGRLRAGAAKACVTPKVGTRMASGNMASEGVLDDIYVRVLLLQEEGKDLVAWLHIDNLYMPGRPEMPPILAEKLKVKPENIFWSATHNHNSGAPWASKAFTDQIIAGFTEAAETAAARMKPVRVAVAKTTARFNFNRVMKGPDGNTYSTLDAKYMTYLQDSRPTDTELVTIWFVGEDARPVAGVVYYTGHANMLCRVMPWLSGDWPGWTERLLEDASGAVVMHVQGPLGDTDMRDICMSYARTIRAGWDVAYAAMRATRKDLAAIDPSALAGVGIRHADGIGTPNEKEAAKGATEHRLPVSVLTLGPVAFCDLGGEAWTRFGLEVRERSPFPHTYLNFSSGYYYPEEWAFEKKVYGTADRMPDWGGVLRDTTVKLLNDAAGK